MYNFDYDCTCTVYLRIYTGGKGVTAGLRPYNRRQGRERRERCVVSAVVVMLCVDYSTSVAVSIAALHAGAYYRAIVIEKTVWPTSLLSRRNLTQTSPISMNAGRTGCAILGAGCGS